MSKVENPHVFPQLTKAGDLAVSDGGLSLRDWFAGQALAGIMTLMNDSGPEHAPLVAKAAYMAADAMLAERAKSEGQP